MLRREGSDKQEEGNNPRLSPALEKEGRKTAVECSALFNIDRALVELNRSSTLPGLLPCRVASLTCSSILLPRWIPRVNTLITQSGVRDATAHVANSP